MNQRNWSVPTILILGICYKLNKILNHASNWYQIMHLIDMHNSMQAIIGFHTSDMSQIVSAKFWFRYIILYFIKCIFLIMNFHAVGPFYWITWWEKEEIAYVRGGHPFSYANCFLTAFEA